MKKISFLVYLLIPLISFSQTNDFNDSIIYESYFNKTVFGEKITHQREVTFGFNGNLMVTSMKDQMSRYRSYGISEKGDDQDHQWKTYQCIDNSGSEVFVTLGYEKATKVQMILIDYDNMYMIFEVNSHKIPEVIYDILDNWSDEEIYTQNSNDEDLDSFLNTFSNKQLITNFLTADVFKDIKHKNCKHEKHTKTQK
jgi:hypothetical protein